MALYLRGKIWHYVFKLRGQEHRGSTHQSNRNRAKIVESKVRADAADALFGIGPAKQAPFFKTFVEDVFLPHIRVRHMSTPNTRKFYEYRCATLLASMPIAETRLSAIDATCINAYIVGRLQAMKKSRGRTGKVGISTINHELTTLRVVLKYARDEARIPLVVPKISRIKGVTGRTFVVSGDLEKAYLDAAPYPLKHAATLMIDLGLRPMEVVGLTKADVFDTHVQVGKSKTPAGRRTLPQTSRSKSTLAELAELWPDTEWVFPGLAQGTHYSASALTQLHCNLRVKMGWPEEFVLYSWRHTFGTRLAESGAGMDTIKKLMGHANILVSQRYIHTSEDHLALSMKRAELYGKMLRGEVEAQNGTSSQESNPKFLQ